MWDVEALEGGMTVAQSLMWQAYYQRKAQLRREEELAAKAAAAVESRIRR